MTIDTSNKGHATTTRRRTEKGAMYTHTTMYANLVSCNARVAVGRHKIFIVHIILIITTERYII